METLKIQFASKNRDEVLEMLQSFPKNGIKIIFQDANFEENKKTLNHSYDKLLSGNSKLYDIDELDEMLEKTMAKNES